MGDEKTETWDDVGDGGAEEGCRITRLHLLQHLENCH